MILLNTQKKEFSKLKDIRVFGKVSSENKLYGDLLIIGLGGIGTKVACSLKGMMMNDITPEDNVGFMVIDSDIPAMEQTIEDSKEGVGFNAMEVVSIYRPNIDTILADGIKKNPVHPNLANWMKEDFPNINIGRNGADGNRQIGRLMLSNAYEDVRMLLFDKVEDMYRRSESGKLDVIIISGIAGGTGSGIISDIAYNIRAYVHAKKYSDVRIGGCLLTPDVLFGIRDIYDNKDKVDIMNANGCATLKEISYYMSLSKTEDTYSFESTTHRIVIRKDIFDACMLVSGRKDEQGYIPDGIICNDAAYFLYKLSSRKYIGKEMEDGSRVLLRDVFFEKKRTASFKILSETDYKIPIREIENICEYDVFSEAHRRLFISPLSDETFRQKAFDLFGELREFVSGKPGEEIKLSLPDIIMTRQFEKPLYKAIKKGQDELRTSMGKKLSKLKDSVEMNVKALKTRLWNSLDDFLAESMKQYGPFAAIEIITADGGLISMINEISEIASGYTPTSEFSRIIESIKDMCAKRFFAFPAAKRETEDGYYDACIKETLASERTILMEGISDSDLYADIVRMLRQKAERLDEIYAQFMTDFDASLLELANNAKRVIGYTMTDAKRCEFLPSDYITEDRIEEFKKGIIRILVDNEANIDNGREVCIKPEMEKIYKNLFAGIGVYAPEKFIVAAFADNKPTLQESNMMFVAPSNETRKEAMKLAAKSFVESASDKVSKKKLCSIKEDRIDNLLNKKYISLPQSMPHFSDAVTEMLVNEPYNENPQNITTNEGEIEISVDDLFFDVSPSILQCADDMQKAYNSTKEYYGLHIDEVNKDMRSYADIVLI